GVNVALMASSECARRFYESLGLNPNLAPITHIPFVLLFGELVPMFAARTYPEHMAKMGIPLLYLSSKILSPCIAVIDVLFQFLNRTFKGTQNKSHVFLSRDELQKLLEEHEAGPGTEKELYFTQMIGNIFSLRGKKAALFMKHLALVPAVSSRSSIE